ncbi:hypothetical protein [Methylobacter sp. sgz302048]|uniref:hypothetical protein n=1 Tax=Methylobacter sp. sgz302048 TaxID=3455945 RepID=UPI003F9EF015
MKLLTPVMAAAMLSLLSQKTKVGIGTPHKGYRPLSNVAFLCPSKTQAALLCRRVSVMAGCIGLPLKRQAGSFAGSSNLMQLAAQRLEPKGGGLSLYKGVTAMRHYYAQNPAKSSQRQSRFNLIKRTPEGRQLICQDLTFAQAVALVAEIPAAIVKFDRMGGAA